METEDQLEVPTLTEAERRLSPRELNAMRFLERTKQPQLSPDTQARFFAAYLSGSTCEDIVRVNPGFSLGQIVRARVDGSWDSKREDYLQDLLANARTLVQQTAMESVKFISQTLAATHKRYGEAAQRYIQSGNTNDLQGGFGIDDIKSYKVAIETLQKLIGADQKSSVEHNVHIDSTPVAAVNKPLTASAAAAIVKSAAAKGAKK